MLIVVNINRYQSVILSPSPSPPPLPAPPPLPPTTFPRTSTTVGVLPDVRPTCFCSSLTNLKFCWLLDAFAQFLLVTFQHIFQHIQHRLSDIHHSICLCENSRIVWRTLSKCFGSVGKRPCWLTFQGQSAHRTSTISMRWIAPFLHFVTTDYIFSFHPQIHYECSSRWVG